MAIRVYKPTTPGRRNASVSDFSDLTRSTPEKSLVRKKSKTGGLFELQPVQLLLPAGRICLQYIFTTHTKPPADKDINTGSPVQHL